MTVEQLKKAVDGMTDNLIESGMGDSKITANRITIRESKIVIDGMIITPKFK